MGKQSCGHDYNARAWRSICGVDAECDDVGILDAVDVDIGESEGTVVEYDGQVVGCCHTWVDAGGLEDLV